MMIIIFLIPLALLPVVKFHSMWLSYMYTICPLISHSDTKLTHPWCVFYQRLRTAETKVGTDWL